MSVKYTPITFDYNQSWFVEQMPGSDRVWLWDHYGFFAYITLDLWMKEVMSKIPVRYTDAELYKVVSAFMAKWQHLYCGVN
jgi:hypothetical protein